MAPEDLKAKKRKGTTDTAQKSKKQKKVDETAATIKKSAKALSAAVNPIDDFNVNVKVSRKRAAEPFEDNAPAGENTTKTKKGNKKSKIIAETDGDEAEPTHLQADVSETKEKTKKSSKPSKPGAKGTNEQKVEKTERRSKRLQKLKEQPETDNAEEDDEDDQTAALLAGFESDNDEDDPEEDAGLDTEVKAEIDPKVHSELEKVSQKTEGPGVIYVGRIPHGFYETQMKNYFKQFGDVNRVRVSRNKRTGAAKHYAFVEFASAEVADIVARTMHNYLMFGHILQCRVVPTAQVHPELFKGSGMRFKRDPRNRKAGAAMEHGVERAVWEKRVVKEQKRRAGRNKALMEEMDYQYTAPTLKAVTQSEQTTKPLAAVKAN